MMRLSLGLSAATLALLLAASAVLVGPGASAQDEEEAWPEIGLPGGPIHGLAMSPNLDEDAEEVQTLAAAGHDVYSSDRGITWTLRSGVEGAYNLAAGPDGHWFAATREGEGYSTRRGGIGWQRVRVRESGDKVRFLATSPVAPEDGQAYAIITDDGRLYRTDTMGSRWSEVLLDRDESPTTGAVAFSPIHGHDEVLFAGSSLGLHKSENAGQTWSLQAAAGASVPAFGLDAGPLESQGLLLPFEWGDDPGRKSDPIVDTIFAWNAEGLWTSEDEAQTWTAMSLPAGVERVNGLAVSPGWPEDPTLVLAASGEGIIGAVSGDGGASWRTVPAAPGVSGTSAALARDFWPIPVPDPFPPLDTDPLDYPIFFPQVMKEYIPSEDPTVSPVVVNREMHIGTDGAGVWRSTDEGESWQASMETLTNVEPTALERLGEEEGSPFLAGSRSSGLFLSADDGESWARVSPGLQRGEGSAIHALAASPDFERDRTVFAGTDLGVFKSSDGGISWTDTGHPAEDPVRALALSPSYAADGTLFAAGHRSTDGGASWTAVAGAERPWSSLAVSPRFAEDRVVLVGTDEIADEGDEEYGLYRSEDGGESFALQTEDRSLEGRALLSLEMVSVVASEDVRAFAGTDNGILASTDGGFEWDRAEGSPSGTEIYALDSQVLTSPFQTAVIVAATERGPYWSTNRGTSFDSPDDAPAGTFTTAIGGGAAPMRIVFGLRSASTYTDLDVGSLLRSDPSRTAGGAPAR